MSPRLKIGLLSVLIFACGLFVLSRFRGKPSVVKPRFEQVGITVGELAAKELDAGDTVLILGRGGDRPMLAAQMKGFEEALGQHIQADVTSAFLPVPTEMEMMDAIGITDAEFAALLEPHGKPDMVVSFLGAPEFGRKTVTRWRAHKPKFIVVGATKQDVKKPLDAGLVDLAFVFRGGKAGLAKKGSSTEEWVDAYYEVLRGRNR